MKALPVACALVSICWLSASFAAESTAPSPTTAAPVTTPQVETPPVPSAATIDVSTRVRASAGTVPTAPKTAVEKQTAVELPPMIVSGGKALPWLYVKAGDTEYLSRCSAATTTTFVTGQLEIERMLRVFLPADLLPANAIPNVSILSALEPGRTNDEVMTREFQAMESKSRRESTKALAQQQKLPSARRVSFLPNLRLDDRDMRAVFTHLNEKEFQGNQLIAAPEYVNARLLARTPTLPAWLIAGISRLYVQASFRIDPITLLPVPWISTSDTTGLIRDADSRRVMLPANEFFAADALSGAGNEHPTRVETWRAQSVLFVRWALDPANAPAADSLWKLVRRVSQEPITESLFRECFGFGYADLQERLSDYLPAAVKQPIRILPGRLPPLPRFEVKPATPVQIARLRGEWERLEIPFVREKHPEFLPHYIEQAQNTLRRAVGEGHRDPQLFAALGLCEVDAGDPKAARPYLDQAAAERIVRPRVYYEIARMEWATLIRSKPENSDFTVAGIEPVLQPLRIAATQTPALPEVFMLMADAWLRCRDPMKAADLSTLVAATPLFRRIPGVAFRVALLQLRYGQRTEAEQMLRLSLEFASENAVRQQLQQVLAAITTPAAKKEEASRRKQKETSTSTGPNE